MPNLTLIRGLPGSGKSTLARKLVNPNIVHIEADQFFINPNTGQYEFNPKSIKTAHNWCLKRAIYYLNAGIDVVVANTFTTKKELEPYLELKQEIGNLTIQIVLCQGNFKSIHDVPESTIKKMGKRFEYEII